MMEPNPFQKLREIATNFAISRALHVVADLGVADRLGDEPRKATDLARESGADPDALARVLRLLAAQGVFQIRGDAFAHSPASRLLRTDHPQSARDLVRMFGLPINWGAYGAMDHTLRTGIPGAAKILPEGFWAYFGERPQESAVFNGAMEAKAQGQIAGILSAYDFSGFQCIADIGGGRGHLLRAVLASARKTKGILFDLPHVVAEAGGAGSSDRLTFHSGDFFKDALPRCDAYVLMEVIHDWADDESAAILSSVRKAAEPGSKLLLIESIIPDDPGPHWSKTLDVFMLTLLGGRQRTLAEYKELLGRAGFSLKREIPTQADITILEAVAS
jgi:hypothetical protein